MRLEGVAPSAPSGFDSSASVAKKSEGSPSTPQAWSQADVLERGPVRKGSAAQPAPLAPPAPRQVRGPGVDGPDERYFTVAEMEAFMDELVAAHPGRAQKIDLTALPGAARTHRGQPIFALRITSDVQGGALTDKPAVVLASQHHARELNSAVVSLYTMRRLLEGYGKDPEITELLDTKEIVVVPTVNPDGVDRVWSGQRMWRKNDRDNGDGTRGVDINRNYPMLWARSGSSSSPGSEIYHGPSAASEPEVRTMMALRAWLQPELYLDIHSSGREVLTLYPSNATVSEEVEAFGRRYADDLRAPMGFGYRPPSASAEAPHYFWSKGALSYLIEIGTSFQPPFPDTVKEEERVWKGLRRALTAWAPAARGHVRGAGGEAVAAEITVTPDIFHHDEASYSRAADGRYSLWLPKGEYQVTFSAPGYAPQMQTIRVEEYDQPIDLEVVLEKREQQAPALSAAEQVRLRRAA